MSIETTVSIRQEREAGSGTPANSPRPGLNAFLAELLGEQQRLHTPVARFANRHASLPARARPVHSELIPLSAPAAGEQYAFEVELDACSGCKACVASCHSLNGLDENETWRDVGLILGGTAGQPYQQTITTACHHCADPGCLNGCPVLAYEKDPLTGIVRHLDDQCIGCQYCVLKCPYDVPKYNERLGIVRKCDMCHDRLAQGEAPACVQACPTHAIRIVTVHAGGASGHASDGAWHDSAGARRAGANRTAASATDPSAGFLASPPVRAHTQPTTRYVSRRSAPANAHAADSSELRPQPAHWPLALMLVLTQAAVGLSGAGVFATYYVTNRPAPPTWWWPMVAWAVMAAGLAASVLHLGQPWRAWRVFLNLRRSWLSREAVILGGCFGALTAAAAAHVLAGTSLAFADSARAAAAPLTIAALVAGMAGVCCSIMIYVDTPRRFWRSPQTAGRMTGTVAFAALLPISPPVAAGALLSKLALEAATLAGGSQSARLQRGPLRRAVTLRLVLGALALLSLIAPWPLVLAGVLWFGGEIVERHLFFRAVDPPQQPGIDLA